MRHDGHDDKADKGRSFGSRPLDGTMRGAGVDEAEGGGCRPSGATARGYQRMANRRAERAHMTDAVAGSGPSFKLTINPDGTMAMEIPRECISHLSTELLPQLAMHFAKVAE